MDSNWTHVYFVGLRSTVLRGLGALRLITVTGRYVKPPYKLEGQHEDSGDGQLSLMFAPMVLADVLVMKAALEIIRDACDLYEQKYVKEKTN